MLGDRAPGAKDAKEPPGSRRKRKRLRRTVAFFPPETHPTVANRERHFPRSLRGSQRSSRELASQLAHVGGVITERCTDLARTAILSPHVCEVSRLKTAGRSRIPW